MVAGKNPTLAGMAAITDDLVDRLQALTFAAPVTHIYHPLVYARAGFDGYVSRFGAAPKPVVLVGMNPGPYGMAQTGVPFGDVEMVRGWMGIQATVGRPANPHPRRPIEGFACQRREVSGQRLWGWAKGRYGHPAIFFQHFFVINYCPLVFMEASGRNRTPDKLSSGERGALFPICDEALAHAIALLQPRWVVGIGGFAEKRVRCVVVDPGITVGGITHPSPANPKANQGWATRVEAQLRGLGVDLPP